MRIENQLRLLLVFGCLGAGTAVLAAESAGGGSTQIEEIVITAQKRTERVQDIPVSAAVVSSDALLSHNASDISDLNKLVPSVNLNGTFNGRVPMGIRGISSVSNEGTVGLSSGVAILIDGVPIPSDSMSGNQIEDIRSVEVLKGPQATLGGRTAATGVINFVTRGPSDTFHGDVTAVATDDSEYRLNGFVSGPITDRVAYSFSAYGNNREYPIRNLQLNKTSVQKSAGARFKLRFRPNDDLDVTLMARYGRMTADGANFTYKFVSPGTSLLGGNHIDPVSGNPVPNIPPLAADVLLGGVAPSLDNRDYVSPLLGASKVEDKDASLILEYRLPGGSTLGSTTAYQHETQNFVQDLFLVNTYFWNALTGAGSGAPGTPPPFFNFQIVDENINQFSEELKLASPTDRDLSYLLGVFYSDSKVHSKPSRDLFPAYDITDVTPKTRTLGIYGRATWKFRPETALVAGLRFNHDSLKYNVFQSLYTLVFPGPTSAFPPVIVADQQDSDSRSTSNAVGDLSLQHHFTPDVMGYATYARGYSPGAFNTVQAIYSATTPTIPTGLPIGVLNTIFPGLISPGDQPKLAYVSDEKVDHFELGLKGIYFDHAVHSNLAIFYTKYKNFQIQNFDLNSKALAPPLILAAAGGAETKGVELDTTWSATANLRLDLNMAYVKATFTDYPNAPCYYPFVSGQTVPGCTYTNGTGTQDLAGKPTPNAPKFKAVAAAQQRIPLGSSAFEAIAEANYSYRSSAVMLADQNPQAVLPSVGILNLQLGLAERSGKYSVTAFVNNVTNKHYFTDLEDFWSAPWGGTLNVVGQPARDSYRYFGIRLNANF
jgi:iron complex outermembrane recepter protein